MINSITKWWYKANGLGNRLLCHNMGHHWRKRHIEVPSGIFFMHLYLGKQWCQRCMKISQRWAFVHTTYEFYVQSQEEYNKDLGSV